MAALVNTANKHLVDFNNSTARAAKRVIAVHKTHILANEIAHAPSGFIGHADGALNFLGRDAIAGRAEHKHDLKPVAQGCARGGKRRASGRIDLLAAMFALIGATGLNAMIAGALAAFAARMTLPKAGSHQVFKAGFLSWEAFLKLAQGWKFGFRVHEKSYSISLYMFQGDISEGNSMETKNEQKNINNEFNKIAHLQY
jgi:hypothetical protein